MDAFDNDILSVETWSWASKYVFCEESAPPHGHKLSQPRPPSSLSNSIECSKLLAPKAKVAVSAIHN